MHSGIVNRVSELLCDAHTVLETHRELQFFFSILLAIVLFQFFFLCICHSWQSLFLFLGASIVWVNNLKRTADLVLWFPDRTSVCTHPWHSVLKPLLNLILHLRWNTCTVLCSSKTSNLKFQVLLYWLLHSPYIFMYKTNKREDLNLKKMFVQNSTSFFFWLMCSIFIIIIKLFSLVDL